MPDVEDIYPLTAPQQGMLFHTLSADRPGTYVEQVVWELRGDLDPGALEQAWQLIVDANPLLRTGFVWREVENPLQVVHRGVVVEVPAEDWRAIPAADQQGRLDEWLTEDRVAGFDLSRPCLARLRVLRVADDRHWLVWSCQHAILDGWSVGELRRELLALHEQLRRGTETSGTRRRPFRDFVAWLRDRQAGEGHAFWAKEMTGYHTPLRLPDGFAPEPDAGLSIVDHELSGEQTVELEAFARRHRLTLNTLIQGAWAILLGGYCGERDVVFGVTSAGRPELPGMEQMIGPFVATTPLRARLREEPVLAWLRGLQARQVEATAHEHTPLTDIHGLSEVPRGVPLFETVLAFENHLADATGAGHMAGFDVETVRSVGHTNYPLTVIVTVGATIRLHLTYDGTRFDRAWMRRMAGHLERILHAFTEDAERIVAAVPMLTGGELAELDGWNATAEPVREVRLDALVLEQCRARPLAEAVVSPTRRLSYGELDARSAALAGRLTGAGARPDQLVAVLLERGWEQVVAVLAVLRAGAAYLPIDPQWPADRIRRLLTLGGCRLAITAERSTDVPGEVRQVSVNDSVPSGQAGEPEPGSAGDLAYVIYTSGSTGEPKGVAIEHRSAVNTVLDINRRFGIRPQDRVLALSALSFDLSVWDIFGTLVAGGTLVMPEPSAQTDPARWVSWVERERVTVWDSVPAMLDVAVDNASGPGSPLSSLRLALLSGDWIPLSLPERIRAAAPDVEVVSLGGATEGSIWSICYPVDAVDPGWDSIPYGRPLSNQTFQVLDGNLRPVPVGVARELFIGGMGVARGYWHDEARTAASFVVHPVTGERLYRTGDLGRRRRDGVIQFLGRVDDQVKINGFRVEPGEVEAALATHPGVTEAIVIADGERDRRRLVGFVVGDDLKVEDLKEFLAARLPHYLVPAVVSVVPEIPLTPNGKVDRAALAAASPAPGQATYLAPETETEKLVASVWAEVLGVGSVGVLDNFFQLGGDSLRSMRVAALLNRAGIRVAIGALFEKPTVRELATVIDSADRQDLPPVTRHTVGGPVPLTYAQEMIQILNALTPNNTAYVPRTAVEFVGDLDVPALVAAVDALVARHSTLRTRFQPGDGGQPHQVVESTVQVAVPQRNLTHLRPEEAERELARIFAEEVTLTFDPMSGDPLFRVCLVQVAARRHVLLIALDHLVCDGRSLGILARDLVELYRAEVSKTAPNLPPLPVDYTDFALWQREHIAGERLARTVDFWRTRMAGAPPMQLPSDRPPVPLEQMRGAVLNVHIEPDIVAGLDDLVRRSRTTMFAVLMAAVQVVVWSQVGEEIITVSAPVGGRTQPELDDLVGCFVHGMLFPTDMTGDPTFTELVGRVRDGLRDAWEHQSMPLLEMAQIQEFSTVNGMGTQGIALEWTDVDVSAVELPGRSGSVWAGPWWPRREGRVDMPPADLFAHLHRSPVNRGIDGEFQYNSMRFDPPAIEAVFEQLRKVLRLVATDAGQRLSDLKVRTATQLAPSH